MFKMLKKYPFHVPGSIFGRMHTGAKLGSVAKNEVYDLNREGSLIPFVIFENDGKKVVKLFFPLLICVLPQNSHLRLM